MTSRSDMMPATASPRTTGSAPIRRSARMATASRTRVSTSTVRTSTPLFWRMAAMVMVRRSCPRIISEQCETRGGSEIVPAPIAESLPDRKDRKRTGDSVLDDPMSERQREAMPRHDPIPRSRKTDYERAAIAWARYKRTMRWMVLLAVVTVGLSLLYLKRSGAPMPLHLVVATMAGVFLTILLGTGLMALVFLGNRSDRDDEAAGGDWNDDRTD